MFDKAFHFEVHDLLTQFIAAMDDVVISRYNKNREKKEEIKVRYVHAPKERVLFDIINKAQNITVPVISVSITSLQRDVGRVFNKIDGLYAPVGRNEKGTNTARIPMPVPVNLSLALSIITNYQSDMDQIISNFVPYSNPYIIICWKIPEEFGVESLQEIRSEVLWDGNISMDYPIEMEAGTKPRFTATTNFTIKGWLFPASGDDYYKNIYFVKSNFRTTSKLKLDYDSLASLSTEAAEYDSINGVLKETEFAPISGSPYITNLYMHTSSGPMDVNGNKAIIGNSSPIIILGKNFNYTTNVLLSSNLSTLYTNHSTFNFKYYPTINGFDLPTTNYKVMSKNAIYINLPFLSGDKVNVNFVVVNDIGWKDTNSINTNLIYISGV
jgi:hypothetical protein